MNPVPFILLAISLPLLLGGCGEKVAVNEEEVEEREGVLYIKGSDTLYTGVQSVFYANGQKMSEYTYKNGKVDWLQLGWYKNGQKRNEVNWKDGKLHGLDVWWHKNGQKRWESNYKDGKMDGLSVYWHENGQKRSEENYKDGNKVEGSAKYWNSKG